MIKIIFKIIIPILIIHFAVIQVSKISGQSMEGTIKNGDYAIISMSSYGIPIPSLYSLDKDLFPDFNNNGHLTEGPSPERGEVIVLKHKKRGEMKHFLKRVFATGGDEIIFTKDKIYLSMSDTERAILKKSKIIDNKRYWINPYDGMNFKNDNFSSFDNAINKFNEHISKNEEVRSPVYIKDLKEKEFEINNKKYNAFYYKVPKGKFFVMGDNINVSEDSRIFGAIEKKDILGKVITVINLTI